MSVDKPIPEGAREGGENYDSQVYFKEVIDFVAERKAKESKRKKVIMSSRRPSDKMREILGRRSGDSNDDSLGRFIDRTYPGQTKEKSIETLKELILTTNVVDDADIVVGMALDEGGNVIDQEIAQAFLDSKKEEVRINIEELKQRAEGIEGKIEMNRAELEQWGKVVELAGEHLANKTKAEKESGKAVMRKLIVLKSSAEKIVERDEQSAREREELKGKIESSEKEMERLEKIKINI